MFVFSVKLPKKKALVHVAIFVVLMMILFFSFKSCSKSDGLVSTSSNYSIDASDNDQRVDFLRNYGWEVDTYPVEVCDIKIPTVFNEVYENYNEIQKDQGLDLKKYMGKPCKRFSYIVKNYPDCKNEVRANILAIDNKIIAGDICSLELDGFMHGFEKKC